MPQMGESVAEGTIVRWIKKVGDAVERDEPLFEISTDKVDAEIPSPVAGILSEIKVQEGETVEVNSVVAVIGEARGASASAPGASADTQAAAPPAAKPAVPSVPRAPLAHVLPAVPGLAKPWSAAEARDLRLSPVVRKIAREHHVDVRNIAGSGAGRRVTKADILGYLEAGAPVSAPSGASDVASGGKPSAPVEGVDRVPMTVMRRKIAEHMVMSRRTSAHVHSVFDVDFTRVDEIRRAGKITYLSFITKATAEALKAVPIVNSSVEGRDILFRQHINIGVAVALDWGLIVPVIKNADTMSLLELSKAIADLAARARDKKLSPDDVQGGTFTITNPGAFGAMFGLPIINQPQVAILCVGAVEHRPVVVNDAVTIRSRAYMALGFDHRIIDGAVADGFMSRIKKTIESWDSA